MKTCNSCKHWAPQEDWDVKSMKMRRCLRVREMWAVEDEVPEHAQQGRIDFKCMGWGASQSEDEKELAERYAAAADKCFDAAKAVVKDYSSYHAELLTRSDFGCILHEGL